MMKPLSWPLALAAACMLFSTNLPATDLPIGSGNAPPKAVDGVEDDLGRQIDAVPRRLPALKGTFTVTGSVDALAETEEAVWAIVAVPQRLLPTHSLIRSDIPSGHAADLGNIGGFAGGALTVAEGSVWAAEGAGGEKVHRIDPASGRIIASIDVSRNPMGLAYGAGAIWVTAADKVNKAGGVLLSVRGLSLYRIDPATNRVVASVSIPIADPPANTMPGTMLAFVGNAVWTGDAWSGTVVRIDPAGERVVATLEAPQLESSGARGIYSLRTIGDRLLLTRYGYKGGRGAEANLVTELTVWQIDQATNRITGEPAHLAREGVVLAIIDGVGWLGSSRVDGLTRVNPMTLQPLAQPLMVGHPVYAIAGGGGSLCAIAGARRTAGDDRNISWVTCVAP